jgi:arsenite methyltransferase
MDSAEAVIASVKKYYGVTLQKKAGSRSNRYCCDDSLPENHRRILSEIDEEILKRFYGCGSPIPPDLEGCVVLDLGCGSGRDAYLASKLVGPKGSVIGIDMTDAQLRIARRHQARQAKRFGFKKSNVDFRSGYIEDLASAGIGDNSIDVVISNCVINLSPKKEKVFSEIFRVLKPGGELLFADVFAGRRVPPALREDPVLLGECLGGAMYIEDFRRVLRSIGCMDYRVLSPTPINIGDPEIEKKTGMIDYFSLTIRAFKLSSLEDISEDYGQVAYYLGSIPDYPFQFALDDHHTFETNKPTLICGNTAAILRETRYGKHFRVLGDTSIHYGPFEGGSEGSGGHSCSGSSCSC